MPFHHSIPIRDVGFLVPHLLVVCFVARILHTYAYLAMTAHFVLFYRRNRGRLPQAGLIIALAACLVLGATTHACSAVAADSQTAWPLVVATVVGAIVAFLTSLLLPATLAYFSGLPTSDEYQAAISQQRAANRRSDRLNAECERLKRMIAKFEEISREEQWSRSAKAEVAMMLSQLRDYRRANS